MSNKKPGNNAQSILLNLARRQIGLLQAEINFRASHQQPWSSPDDLAASNQKLLRLVRQSRLALLQLSTCLEKSGSVDNPEEDCKEIAALVRLIHEATLLSSELHASVHSEAKRRTLKAFEASVLAVIQDGQGPSYMRTVTREKILNHGDEVNRLYQLLTDGGGKMNSDFRFVDAATLQIAAQRTDLFSPNQCAKLQKRSAEVEAWMVQETERLASEIVAREDHDSFRRELQNLFKADAADEGSTRSNNNVSEKKEEAKQQRSSPGEGWACSACTFYNEDASLIQCGVCGTPQYSDFVTVAKRKPSSVIDKKNSDISSSKYSSPASNSNKSKSSSSSFDASKKTVWIHITDVPELIGPSAKHIHELRHETGAKSIYAYAEHADQNGMCPVQIQGTPATIRAAVAAIEQRFPRLLIKDASSQQQHYEKNTVSTELFIQDSAVAELIGPCGTGVQALIKQTGVDTIYADQERLNQFNWCPVEIRGSPDSVAKAAAMISHYYASYLMEAKVVWIANAEVGRFIGPRGLNVQALKKETGIQWVTAEQDKSVDGLCPVRIEGSSIAVKKATDFVIQQYDGSLDKPPGLGKVKATVVEQRLSEEKEKLESEPQSSFESSAASGDKVSISVAAGTRADRPPQAGIKVASPDDSSNDGSFNSNDAVVLARDGAPPPPSFPQYSNSYGSVGGVPLAYSNPYYGAPQEAKHYGARQLQEANLYGSPPHPPPPMVAPSTPGTNNLYYSTMTNMVVSPSKVEDAVVAPKDCVGGRALLAMPPGFETQSVTSTSLAGNSTTPSETIHQSIPSKDDADNVLDFLQQHKSAFKCTAHSFLEWLQSMDIESLHDMAEAMEDDEIFEEMKQNGFKAFKRKAVLKDIEARLKIQEEHFDSSGSSPVVPNVTPTPEPPSELVCPIGHALFRDPVLAADGHCYERVEIESWFRRAQSIGNHPLSPLTGEPMPHLSLTPNIPIATMARDFLRNNPTSDVS